MIKGLTGTGGVAVSGGNTALPYVGANPSNPMTGIIRVHNTDLEVFNGSAWQMLPSYYSTVGLDQEILDIIQWARKSMHEEEKIKVLMEKHPGLKSAREQFEIMKILVTQENNNV